MKIEEYDNYWTFFYRKLLHIVRLDYLPPMSNSSNTAIVSKVIRDNLGLHGSFFTSLRDCSRKFAPLSKPIRCKTQTNHDLVNRVFPRFRQLNCLYFEFSLALKGIFLSFDWPFLLIWIWFHNTQSKGASCLQTIRIEIAAPIRNKITYLRGVDNGGKVLNTVHPKIWHCNCASLELMRLKFVISGFVG